MILVAVLGGAALAIATSSAAPAVVGTLIGILIIAGVLAYSRAAALRPATMPDGSPGIDIPGHGAFRLTPDNES